MTDATMPRQDRLRRVVILCRNFAVNLAYYRVGRKSGALRISRTIKPEVISGG